jgi:hypothetical protein
MVKWLEINKLLQILKQKDKIEMAGQKPNQTTLQAGNCLIG